jgi:hypothetical protein
MNLAHLIWSGGVVHILYANARGTAWPKQDDIGGTAIRVG